MAMHSIAFLFGLEECSRRFRRIAVHCGDNHACVEVGHGRGKPNALQVFGERSTRYSARVTQLSICIPFATHLEHRSPRIAS